MAFHGVKQRGNESDEICLVPSSVPGSEVGEIPDSLVISDSEDEAKAKKERDIDSEMEDLLKGWGIDWQEVLAHGFKVAKAGRQVEWKAEVKRQGERKDRERGSKKVRVNDKWSWCVLHWSHGVLGSWGF